MKTKNIFIGMAAVAAMFTACSGQKDENPMGSWVSSAPESVTQNVAGASSAVKTVSLNFRGPETTAAGELVYTADYDVTMNAEEATDSVKSYKVTATINGTWIAEKGEDDDYLLTFDKNTLSVSGIDAPGLGAVTDEFLNSISGLTKIEDVEVSKDGTHLTFEAGKPEVKYHFIKQ